MSFIKNSLFKPAIFGISICLAILMLGSPATAFSEDSDTELLIAAKEQYGDADELLDELRTMRFSGEVPSLNGSSPAQIIKLSPPADANEYTTAYKSKSNCVVFYSPLAKTFHDLAVKWEGEKCNGKPIQGKGTLTIIFKEEANPGDYVHILVYQGGFKNGMLTGQGKRINLMLLPDGKLKESTYELAGEFAYGMLNGAGTRTWTGSTTDEPSAWVQTGSFKDGVPSGLITFSRLHPFKGIEADSGERVLNSDGEIYTYQWFNNGKKAVKGVMYFYDDPIQWQIITSEVGTGSMLGNASIQRADRSSVFFAKCENLDVQHGHLSCTKGLAVIQSPTRPTIGIENSSFEIPVPFNTSGVPIRVGNGSHVKIGDKNIRSGHEMSCNEDLSSCRGEAIVNIGTNAYWWGESEFSGGNLKPVSGILYEAARAFEVNRSNDKKLASCEEFSSPTKCDRGMILGGANTWSGGYTLDGIEYSTSGGYKITAEWGPLEVGNGRVTFGNGRWVEAYMNSGELVSVGDCDDPSSSSKFTCSLQGGTITFEEHRREAHKSSSNSNYNSYGNSGGGERFRPIQVPQRQPYVLPGMQ